MPYDVRITGGELRIRVGRYDPAAAGKLSIDPRSGTASLLVAVEGPDGNSAGPGLRKYFDLYVRPRTADAPPGSTKAEPAEGAGDDAAGTPGRDGVTVEMDQSVYDLLTREKRDGETCNDVVRRLLGMPPAS